MFVRVTVVILVTFAIPTFAQHSSGRAAAASGPAAAVSNTTGSSEGLTVADIVIMTAAQIPDDVIVTKLRQQNKSFNLTTEDLVRLQKARVSPSVMRVMMDPKAEVSAPAPQPQPAAAATQPLVIAPNGMPSIPGVRMAGGPSGATPAPGAEARGDPNDPNTPHDSGIYLMTRDRDGKPKMLAMERASYQGAKSGGYLASAMTYGLVKAKTKAVIPGPHAGIQVNESSPVFYFYFDDKQMGLGKSYFGVTNLSNPNQFALLKLQVKGNNRESTVGEFSSLGSSSGADSKAMMPFRSERIRPGLYKVTVEDLKPGEYCFVASSNMAMATPYSAGMTVATDIFDFGVEIN